MARKKSEPTYYTPEEYAKKKEVTLKTVYNWINSGKVETTKMFKKTVIID